MLNDRFKATYCFGPQNLRQGHGLVFLHFIQSSASRTQNVINHGWQRATITPDFWEAATKGNQFSSDSTEWLNPLIVSDLHKSSASPVTFQHVNNSSHFYWAGGPRCCPPNPLYWKKKLLPSLYWQGNHNIHRLGYKRNLFSHFKASTSILSRWHSAMSLAPLSLFKAFNSKHYRTADDCLENCGGCRVAAGSHLPGAGC